MAETQHVVQLVSLRRLLEIERGAAHLVETTGVDSLRRLADLVANLAKCAAETLQLVPPIPEQRSHIAAHADLERRVIVLEHGQEIPVEASILEPGAEYDLTLRVRATVVERHDGHGLCYKIQLQQREYVEARIVDLDGDEVCSAIRRD